MRHMRRPIAVLAGLALLPALATATPAAAEVADPASEGAEVADPASEAVAAPPAGEVADPASEATAGQPDAEVGSEAEVTPPSGDEQWRGYWVDAFNRGIYDADQVATLVADATSLGANVLVVQVGRRFDCFCNDALYPRTDAAIAPAPYDPLAEIVEQGHAAGLEVHAWVNATTLWNSATPPTSPEHAFNAHGPSAQGADRWLNKRVDGTELVGANAFIDPAHPAAVDYVAEAVSSITAAYDVDGVNLDYIRYPDYNTGELVNDWGYSETSLARFAAETGRTDVPAPDDAQFSDWRRDQVSAVVRKVYVAMYGVDPSDRLSINGITYSYGPATYGSFEASRPYANVMQDWKGWLDEGIVDTVTAMNYKREWNPDQARMFAEWNQALVDYRAGRHVVSGPALYLNEVEDSVAQAEQVVALGLDGWMGYSYANPSLTGTPAGQDVKDAERAELTQALRSGVFADDVVVPEMTWRTEPTTGLLSGNVDVRHGGVADQVDVVLHPVGRTPGEPVVVRTDGSGWFGAVDLAPGRYRVQVVEEGATGTSSTHVRVRAGEVADVDVRVRSLR